MDISTTKRTGWLKILDSSEGNDQYDSRWCVLDNGILWLYRLPGEQAERVAFSLQDAIVGECDPPAPLHLAVKCRRSGRSLVIITLSNEDYHQWLDVMTLAAREWRQKRRASVITKQTSLATDPEKDNDRIKLIEEFKFTPRRKSEAPIRPSILPLMDSTSFDEVELKSSPKHHQSLKDIIIEKGTIHIRWAKLNEVVDSGLLGILNEEQIALEEIKFSALVEEFRFNSELSSLLRLTTRAVSWHDPLLPTFNRRSIVASVTKVKKSSDNIIKLAELHWSEHVTLKNMIFKLFSTEAKSSNWCESYIDYCSHLAELREFLKRAARQKAEVAASSYSTKYNLELALIPVQHLTSLRQLMQTLFELIPPGATEHNIARSSRDFFNEILDSCYQELTEQSGSEYVAEMDNELQFDLSNLTTAVPSGPHLLYRRKPRTSQVPTNSQDTGSVANDDKNKFTKAKRPSLFNTEKIKSAAQYLRRKTSEGLGLQKSRTASMPNLLVDVPTDHFAKANAADNHTEISSDSDNELDLATIIPSPKIDVILEVPKYFNNEPFYQEYALSIAEELADRAMSRDFDEYSQKYKSCSKWTDDPRVIETGLLRDLSDERRQVIEYKFEIIAAEAAYVRSIRFLESHFAHCPEMYDEDIISPTDRHLLFAGIETHRSSSERLLASMETCWEDDVFLDNLCAIVRRHATSASAKVAAAACSNQFLIVPTLKRLMSKQQFVAVLTRLECSSLCGGFALVSFLTLPYRRLGRLKLMLDNIANLLGRIQETKLEERIACESARDAIVRLLAKSENSGKRYYSDTILQELSIKLSFRKVPKLAITAEGRSLIHQGNWKVLGRRENRQGPMRAKSAYPDLQVFLLSDVIILATIDVRAGESLIVVDYSSRHDLTLKTTGPGGDEPLPGFLNGDDNAKSGLYVSYCSSHLGKIIELIVNCGGSALRARWLGAGNSESMLIPSSVAKNTKNQLALRKSLKSYEPQSTDEARLALGDVIAVLRNPGDGWLLTRNLFDGSRGWTPTEESVQLCSGRKSVTFLIDPRYSIA